MAEWTNEEFFNLHFNGPNLLRLKLNEDTRLKLLDSIILRLNNHKPMHFNGSDEHLNNAIKNSIVDGKIGEIPKEWQKKHSGNIIQNTIQKVLCRYGEIQYNTSCISSIDAVWYVLMKAGDFHMLHNHIGNGKSSAELSGAIYLKVPDNLSRPQGNICWISGESTEQMHTPHWQELPEPGDVFLWPSWLMHTVYPFRSKQDRLMISFNGTAICK